MKATAELQVVPIGEGVSVRRQITRVVELLRGYEFIVETHASGTNIEGDLADIFAAVGEIHQSLYRREYSSCQLPETGNPHGQDADACRQASLERWRQQSSWPRKKAVPVIGRECPVCSGKGQAVHQIFQYESLPRL